MTFTPEERSWTLSFALFSHWAQFWGQTPAHSITALFLKPVPTYFSFFKFILSILFLSLLFLQENKHKA